MNTIKVQVQKHVATITLNRPKSNAMNLEMIQELSEILHHISHDAQIAGVVITGQENFFSAGLDLIELYHKNATELRAFWIQFMQFVRQLVAFPKPMVSAINGHSPAGGCIIALASDVRIMAEGNFHIGLNEIPVGIIVPHPVFKLYAFTLGEAKASKHLLQGTLFSPTEALNVGLIDELVTQQNIQTTAERIMNKLIRFESNTWQKSKLNIRRELIQVFDQNQEPAIDEMLEQWWNPKTRAILEIIINNLTKKN